jgi:hypothetical protein
MLDIRRHEFLTLLGGATAWPLAARAQQLAIPLVGYLSLGSTAAEASRVAGLKQGFSQTGYVEYDRISFRGQPIRSSSGAGGRPLFDASRRCLLQSGLRWFGC